MTQKIFTLVTVLFLLTFTSQSALIQGVTTPQTETIRQTIRYQASGRHLHNVLEKGLAYRSQAHGQRSAAESFQAVYLVLNPRVSPFLFLSSKIFSSTNAFAQLLGRHGFHPEGVNVETFRQTALTCLNTIWINRQGVWNPDALKAHPFNIGNAKKYMGHTALWSAVLHFDPFHKGFITGVNRDLGTAWGFLNNAEEYITTKSLFLLKAAALVEGVTHGWNPYPTPQERDDSIEGFLEAFEARRQGGRGSGIRRAPQAQGLVRAKSRLVDGSVHDRIQAYLDQLQQAGLGAAAGGDPPPPPPHDAHGHDGGHNGAPPPPPHHGAPPPPPPPHHDALPSLDADGGANLDNGFPDGHVGPHGRDLAEEERDEEVSASRRKGKGRRIVESSDEEEEDLRASAKKRGADFSQQGKEKRHKAVKSSDEEVESEDEAMTPSVSNVETGKSASAPSLEADILAARGYIFTPQIIKALQGKYPELTKQRVGHILVKHGLSVHKMRDERVARIKELSDLGMDRDAIIEELKGVYPGLTKKSTGEILRVMGRGVGQKEERNAKVVRLFDGGRGMDRDAIAKIISEEEGNSLSDAALMVIYALKRADVPYERKRTRVKTSQRETASTLIRGYLDKGQQPNHASILSQVDINKHHLQRIITDIRKEEGKATITPDKTEKATRLVNRCLEKGVKVDSSTIRKQAEITENQLRWIIKKCKEARKSAASAGQ